MPNVPRSTTCWAFVGGEHQRSEWDSKRRGRTSNRLIEAALVLASVCDGRAVQCLRHEPERVLGVRGER